MSIRVEFLLIFSLSLLSSSFQQGVIAPWIPAKDALVTIPASAAGPSATYVRFEPTDVAAGRRMPAVFLIKTPKEEDVVAFLTGIDGELNDDLLTSVTDGDKILWEYLMLGTQAEKQTEERLKDENSQHHRLPPPFDKLRLTRVQLPRPYLSLQELARFSASKHPTPTGKISIVLVAERSEVFP